MRFASLLFVSSATALSIGAHRASAPVRRAAVSPQCSIAVFGGTGGTGGEAVFQALGRGESVVTLARDPSKMTVPEGSGGSSAGNPLTNDELTVFKGSVTNKADVDDFRKRSEAQFASLVGGHHEHGTGPVGHLARRAGGMNAVLSGDRLEVGEPLNSGLTKAAVTVDRDRVARPLHKPSPLYPRRSPRPSF